MSVLHLKWVGSEGMVSRKDVSNNAIHPIKVSRAVLSMLENFQDVVCCYLNLKRGFIKDHLLKRWSLWVLSNAEYSLKK